MQVFLDCRPCLSLRWLSGDFCEHCSSPDFCAAKIVELRSSPKANASLGPFQGTPAPIAPEIKQDTFQGVSVPTGPAQKTTAERSGRANIAPLPRYI